MVNDQYTTDADGRITSSNTGSDACVGWFLGACAACGEATVGPEPRQSSVCTDCAENRRPTDA